MQKSESQNIENERATLDDIDRSAIDYFLKKAITTDRMPITSLNDSTEDILYNLNLITDEGKLKMLNLIDREGGRKEGSWIVVKDVVKDVVKGVVKGEQIKKQ